MAKLSEEEIIEQFEHWIEYEKQHKDKINKVDELIEIQQGLLDLYKQEKDKNIELATTIDALNTDLKQEKEKNRWRPISEYDRKKYDWVLVKYFDGDYECVPEVAEKRANGKWYTSDREIPFEVKYFVDIQELLEE